MLTQLVRVPVGPASTSAGNVPVGPAGTLLAPEHALGWGMPSTCQAVRLD